MSRADELVSVFDAVQDQATEALDMLDGWGLSDTGATGYLKGTARAIASLAGTAAQAATDEAGRFPEDIGHRHGGFVMTASMGRFWPLDPRPAEVSLIDIAHALSNKCRWGGFPSRFMSVAEHSLHVAHVAQSIAERAGCTPDIVVLAAAHGLLHDAEEAYLPDIPRPVKAFIPGWSRIAARVQDACLEAIGIGQPPVEVDLIVQKADNISLMQEARELFEFDYDLWDGGLPEGVEVPSYVPDLPTGDHPPQYWREQMLAAMEVVRSSFRESVAKPTPSPSGGSEWHGEVVKTERIGGPCAVCGNPGADAVLGLCPGCLDVTV